jgi:alpha-D-ribose 1-methylphosphonate 5-triphosphate synthase subunit PhnH
MDTEIKESEKKKDALYLDVNSFYSDKLPEWFSKEWDQEEKEYTESLNLIYETTSELIEKR